MCGIAVIIKKDKNDVKKEVKKMTDIISHRGPDAEGFYFQDNFAFGHRRLSIIDLTEEGNQPMHYNGLAITYNGEIYNYIEIKEKLITKGYEFYTKTDTEVILAAYQYWGEKCVEYFNGMWAFAIFDPKKNIIFCSRDRFGIKPFYYTKINGNFYFGSEIKQFTVIDGWKAKANINRVLDSLIYGMFDHTDETLFDKVYQLRGGHNLVIDLNSLTHTIDKWYFIEQKNVEGKKGDLSSLFLDEFKESVKLRLRADVKTGACLSGGLDSSSIVCVINELFQNSEGGTNTLETISSCFKEKKYDEQEYIDEVIAKTEITAHKIFPDLSNLFEFIPELVWIQDEPFMSSSIYAQYKVFEGAKNKGMKVMLDGQGADETLGGYIPIFFELRLRELLRKLDIVSFVKEIRHIKKLHGINPIALLQKAMIPSSMRNFIHTANFKKLIKKDILEDYKLFKRTYFNSIKETSTHLVLTSNVPQLLHYEDRNSMANSIESRVPFLDHKLVELIVNLPSNMKISSGKTKYILRESMSEILPKSILERHDKLGFVTPETQWISANKDLFRAELEKALNVISPLINKNYILNQFENNEKPLIGSIYFRCIVFAEWVKRFNITF